MSDTDVFISYKSEESGFAGTIAAQLELAGYKVWWDRALVAGDDYQRVIHENLSLARLVIVIWSWGAISSDWVRSEAELARQHGKIIPIRIDNVQLWPPFTALQTLDLTNWRGELAHKGWRSLLSSVESRIGAGRAVDASISKMGHLIHKLKAKDSTGKWAYYFVLVEPKMEKPFMMAIEGDGMIDLRDYGKVIASCYGEQPNPETRAFLKMRYGFNV
ncbi:MAG: toll/interleukin-1 receptor domain-containing protein [Hyphomicrobium sp.]|nr:toll/interleukin-1 receptor domain-containing protein [Hyphomicrobium sp.]